MIFAMINDKKEYLGLVVAPSYASARAEWVSRYGIRGTSSSEGEKRPYITISHNEIGEFVGITMWDNPANFGI